MKTISNQKATSILSSVRALNEQHSEALDQLSTKALENIDNDQALEQIERSAVTLSSYKKGSSRLLALMEGNADSKRVAASLLADAKRTLRVKDYAKFEALVKSLQTGARKFDAGLTRFAKAFLSMNSEKVDRRAFETHAAKSGTHYKNNVASGERLLRALGLHDVEREGNRIVSFFITDAEGYEELRKILK